jgi:hypothetical protein
MRGDIEVNVESLEIARLLVADLFDVRVREYHPWGFKPKTAKISETIQYSQLRHMHGCFLASLTMFIGVVFYKHLATKRCQNGNFPVFDNWDWPIPWFETPGRRL